jgi:HJR/Mrr/RecB family endonuclease
MGNAETSQGFQVSSLYSIDEIQTHLGVGNAGGVRVYLETDDLVRRAVILTSDPSARQLSENPYHDRIEGDVLVYTGAGREGDQSLGGINRRIPQQGLQNFPIYGFVLIGSRRDPKIGRNRWRFLGLLEYLRHYPEVQVDTRGSARKVWLFELRVHATPPFVRPDADREIAAEMLDASRAASPITAEEREIVLATDKIASEGESAHSSDAIESTRAKLLGLAPDRFEHLVKDLLVQTGFDRVTVTRFSQDGGIDVNAYAGGMMWPMRNLLVQIQAKRWLHTVGRKEVAELRGSLAPYAHGAIVTTSHFSKAAMSEASDAGKAPIVLVDGYETAKLVLDSGLAL